MSWINALLMKADARNDVDWDGGALEAEMTAAVAAEARQPILAVEHATGLLARNLIDLENEDAFLAKEITDLTERLRQVRVTRKALGQAYEALQADSKIEQPRIPQA